MGERSRVSEELKTVAMNLISRDVMIRAAGTAVLIGCLNLNRALTEGQLADLAAALNDIFNRVDAPLVASVEDSKRREVLRAGEL